MPKYGLITVDLRGKRLNGVVTRNCLEVYGAFEDVLMISLAPLYRRRGWFPLHAFAALAPDGRVALLTDLGGVTDNTVDVDAGASVTSVTGCGGGISGCPPLPSITRTSEPARR